MSLLVDLRIDGKYPNGYFQENHSHPWVAQQGETIDDIFSEMAKSMISERGFYEYHGNHQMYHNDRVCRHLGVIEHVDLINAQSKEIIDDCVKLDKAETGYHLTRPIMPIGELITELGKLGFSIHQADDNPVYLVYSKEKAGAFLDLIPMAVLPIDKHDETPEGLGYAFYMAVNYGSLQYMDMLATFRKEYPESAEKAEKLLKQYDVLMDLADALSNMPLITCKTIPAVIDDLPF